MNKTDALHEGLLKMLNYLPMIYNQQRIGSSAFNGTYTIKYPYTSIPNNALIFMLPLYSSVQSQTLDPNVNKLTIKYATVIGTEINYNESRTYNIYVENIDGTKRPATAGDIVANKLCMFRFISNNNTDIILCNSAQHGSISYSQLTVTNEAKFYGIPKYVHFNEVTQAEVEDPLVLTSELNDLKDRVTALENKFKVGTKPADEYFSENPNLANGTIYLQVEE